jgi:protein ImuB
MSRTMLVWCPDWPVAAAGLIEDIPIHEPVAVLAANRVLACSEAARAEGVRRGLRKREAQGRCPRLVVLEHDPARDARAFEPVVAAIEELAPGVEVVRPGAGALTARGPSRYFGSEAAAAERIVEHLAQSCGVEAQIGVADGVFAAGLAARTGQLVPAGGTPDFLADIDIEALDRPALVDLLRRLGVRTLGAFAALPPADVMGRFGVDAALAHRLAAGRDERPLAARQPPPDLDVAQTFDEPLERVDTAAFAARKLAERLHARLAGHGLACTRLGIAAVTEHGTELYRTWRHDGLLTATAIADRVRWQLDGWLTRSAAALRSAGPQSGIIRLRLYPDGLLEYAGLQLGLWGDVGEERDRAHRALTRVQGMLGPEAVFTGALAGGRDPAHQARLVPWGEERPEPPQEPWPGRLPAPSPASVPPDPLPVDVFDATGAPVGVTARLAITEPPVALMFARAPGRRPDPPAGAPGRCPDPPAGAPGRRPDLPAGAPGRPAWPPPGAAGRRPDPPAGALAHLAAPAGFVEIAGWAGPWPVDERWWAPEEASRRVQFQVCLADGRALLLTLESGTWSVSGVYD